MRTWKKKEEVEERTEGKREKKCKIQEREVKSEEMMGREFERKEDKEER